MAAAVTFSFQSGGPHCALEQWVKGYLHKSPYMAASDRVGPNALYQRLDDPALEFSPLRNTAGVNTPNGKWHGLSNRKTIHRYTSLFHNSIHRSGSASGVKPNCAYSPWASRVASIQRRKPCRSG
jgi:hypothetical protein